jgi:hypothetical protein
VSARHGSGSALWRVEDREVNRERNRTSPTPQTVLHSPRLYIVVPASRSKFTITEPCLFFLFHPPDGHRLQKRHTWSGLLSFRQVINLLSSAAAYPSGVPNRAKKRSPVHKYHENIFNIRVAQLEEHAGRLLAFQTTDVYQKKNGTCVCFTGRFRHLLDRHDLGKQNVSLPSLKSSRSLRRSVKRMRPQISTREV